MNETNLHSFVLFSLRRDTGTIEYVCESVKNRKLILPQHIDSENEDEFYLPSMLNFFDSSKECWINEILDAFPVLSLTTDKQDKFYALSVERLRAFSKDKVKIDDYIRTSLKHLYMYRELETPSIYAQVINQQQSYDLLDRCLCKVKPILYTPNERDSVNSEDYRLSTVASYVPTFKFCRMKLLKGWIHGALHFYNYSIMFFDNRVLGYNDFNENIIDITNQDLFAGAFTYKNKIHINISTLDNDDFKLDESELYYEMYLHISSLNRNWFYTSPNNNTERDGKIMMFRNDTLKSNLEKALTSLFKEGTFRLNDVFKWNYYANGGKFHNHFDTMFVQKSTDECSLYTLLVYLDVQGDDSFIFLSSGEKELKVKLKDATAYVIPHWVKHHVEGDGTREFLKTEIIFPNKSVSTTFDQALADAFDQSCYYMLQSVRHPQLKAIVSQNFNTINEARFFNTQYLTKLQDNVYILKTIDNLPIDYRSIRIGGTIQTVSVKFNYITDGNYYYFKTNTTRKFTSTSITMNEAIIILSVMHLDIQPKKMFSRNLRVCKCKCPCIDYTYCTTDFNVEENIIGFWKPQELESKVDAALSPILFPRDLETVVTVGNVSVPDIHEKPTTFYFAACQNIYDVYDYMQTRITEITAKNENAKYNNINVEFIGRDRNIVKIRQHSFHNGIRIARTWKPAIPDDVDADNDNNETINDENT